MHRAIWIARGLLGAVFFFNLQCAILFLGDPHTYAPGFELSGPTGEAMIRGFGLLFLMWNVPYAFALWHPQRFFVSLIEATFMQAIGLTGEVMLFFSLPPAHPLIQSSVKRFIFFDGGGLVALLIALAMVYRYRHLLVGRNSNGI
jgi:hypothetical protein